MCKFLLSVWTGPPIVEMLHGLRCFHRPRPLADIESNWGGAARGEFLPEAVWPGGSSSRQDPEPEPGGAEEQEEGRAETDWFPWGEVRDNRSQPSRESSPVRESETAWQDEVKPEGQGVTVKIRLLAEGEQANAFG